MDRINKIKTAMLAVQRQAWEQGVSMQALYELGDVETAFAMAYEAVYKQQPDGRFHDILDDDTSFTDGAAAMMLATAIYRGVTDGWLDDSYFSYAECIYATMEKVTLNAFGYLPDVCGSPDFISSGTSAEAQAAYLLMYACRQRYIEKKPSNMAK